MSDTVWTPEEMAALYAVLAEKDATIGALLAQSQTDYQAGWQMGYEKGQRHDFVLVGRLEDRIAALESQLATAQQELSERDASFDMRWKADMRAIEQWQAVTGEELKWPNHSDLCVWLMQQLATLQAATPVVATLSPTERGIIEAMVEDWSQLYEPGSDEWNDAKKIDAWLNGYKGTMYGDATPVADAEGLQPICAKCNDYLEPPAYCETCYDTAVNAWREAEAALVQRKGGVPVEVLQVAIECIESERSATANMMDNWKVTSDTYKKYAAQVARIDAALVALEEAAGWEVALPVNEYQIEGGHGPRDTESITLKRQPQREGPDKWAVNRGGWCLTKKGQWEYEPMPSSRTARFLKRCRFDTAQEALAFYQKCKRKRQPAQEGDA